MPTVSNVQNQAAGLGGDESTILTETLKLDDQGSNLAVQTPSPLDNWYYPIEIKNDLQGVGLPPEFIEEALACGWEYVRCIVPHFTNWDRYIAFTRTIIIGTIAEFRGSLVDITAGSNILGYNLDELLDTLFAGTPGRDEMARHFRSFILFSAEKSSDRRESDLFRRYVDALARSPRDWFRLRDSDAIARYSMAAALACNDFDEVWFTDAEFEMLSEIGTTLYDAVAFHKHRRKEKFTVPSPTPMIRCGKSVFAEAAKSFGVWTLHGHTVPDTYAWPISCVFSAALFI